ncbi:MAG: DUF2207 domain-containing protein [Parcubacteria group bacterium]|nr:DUF2207 domain-containing protein [Parcubacteria group bacterium]
MRVSSMDIDKQKIHTMVKRYLLPKQLFLILFFVLFATTFSYLHAQNTTSLASSSDTYQRVGERIDEMNVDITVHPDATITVREDIIYNFGTLRRHGIFRDIPVRYKTNFGNNFNFLLSDITVVDETGTPYSFAILNKGNDKEVKIGDPNKEITGVHQYIISYTVDRPIGYFSNFDEIYWNATGNEWLVPIIKSEAIVHVPTKINKSDLKISCYVGQGGSMKRCEGNTDFEEDKTTIRFTSPQILSSKEGMTIAVGFPKGIVLQPSAFENAWYYFVNDLFVYLVPFFVFILMFVYWYRNGRDPKGRGIIIPYYDVPENLSPMEVGGVFHYESRDKDISAELISLAVQGYIRIEQVEDPTYPKNIDYVLKKLKDSTNLLNDHDRLLMSSLFLPNGQISKKILTGMAAVNNEGNPLSNDVKNFLNNQVTKLAKEIDAKQQIEPQNNDTSFVTLSSLKNSFYMAATEIRKTAMRLLVREGFFETAPGDGIRTFLIVFFSIFMLIGGGILSSVYFGLSGFIATFLTIAFFAFFLFIMPRRTERGVAIYEQLLGFKEYLQIAEKDRINFHDAPEKRPAIFEKLLPYAIVLGVEKAWAKEFEDIYTTPPSWYSSASNDNFSALAFTSSLTSFSSSAASNLTSSPSSSSGSDGGGSSGGGGGGGGGGSW